MITEPRIDIFSLLAEQKLRDTIESFERYFLDYRYPEVEDGETENKTDGFRETAENTNQQAIATRSQEANAY